MADHHSRTPPVVAEMVGRERNIFDGCAAADVDPEPTFREDERKEQDAETSEVSEDGESEREDEYNFQFEGEMDPLSFVDGEDTSSVPLYEVFQRIEDQYKALAAKKRPAPDNNERYSNGFLFSFFTTHFHILDWFYIFVGLDCNIVIN